MGSPSWVATGNVTKMEDFVVAVFNGQVFLMNDKHFFPENIRPDLPKFELLKSILLYDPSQHRDGLDVDQALKATPFFAYLGSYIWTKTLDPGMDLRSDRGTSASSRRVGREGR